MYFGDDDFGVKLRTLYAIREGKLRWGYKFPGPDDNARALFAADGRVWVEQQYDSGDTGKDRRFFVYNSRGEGGLTAITKFPDLALYENITWHAWGQGGVQGWSQTQQQFEYKTCELGELTGISSDQRWKLRIEGTCQASAVNNDGHLITVTDAGTLYCVNPNGRIGWTQKAACVPPHVIALGSTGAVYPCANILHAAGGNGGQWTFPLEQEIDYSSVYVDEATTLYLLSKEHTGVLAIDKAGKRLWQLPFVSARPLGLDKSGRMYIRSGNTVVCLSDAA